MSEILTAVYTVGFLALSLFGAKVLLLTIGYWRTRGQAEIAAGQGPQPVVTVQLPIYNERYVAARAIDAVCRIRWPRDRFEVQVLDDSDDATSDVVDAAADAWRSRGVDVTVVRRGNRAGYKAGALANGTTRARGDVLAVFDADFVPPPDFLERTVPYLGPGVAVVQTRWGHLNDRHSLVTRVQAMVLDSHFVVEQAARARNGLFVNFNGTGGIWRRAAIDAAGGWQGDTLSEDIDLSYRAQVAGWRVVFLPQVVVPAELPTTVLAFKRQQRRWSKGTTQLLRKLGPSLWSADRPLVVRVHAIASLAEHLMHPLTVVLILGAPLLVVYRPALPAALGCLWLLALAPPLMYAVAAAALYSDWRRRMLAYPLTALLAIGLCVNGTVAVLEALLGHGGPFERTPKSGDTATGGEVRQRLQAPGYRLPLDHLVLTEAFLATYTWLGLALAIRRHAVGWTPLFLLFALGFTTMATLSLRDGLADQAARWRHDRATRRSRGGAAA